jgi:hypothetical protein
LTLCWQKRSQQHKTTQGAAANGSPSASTADPPKLGLRISLPQQQRERPATAAIVTDAEGAEMHTPFKTPAMGAIPLQLSTLEPQESCPLCGGVVGEEPWITATEGLIEGGFILKLSELTDDKIVWVCQ